ncbi:MAG: hypothetical protein GTO41_12065, partial [Burkholderiales bacterium]|nr:hypothetical protein [Burkholderiales bacterium]
VRALGKDEPTELGKRVRKLGGNARFFRTQTAKTEFNPTGVFKVTRLVEDESQPDEEVKGTRAKAMRRPKRNIEDLQRENRDDVRKGRNVTPIEL